MNKVSTLRNQTLAAARPLRAQSTRTQLPCSIASPVSPFRRSAVPCPSPLRERSRRSCIRVSAASSGGEELSLAPGASKTPFGDMLRYYLEMEPQLFQTAVDEQFTKLRDSQDKAKASQEASPTAALDLVLYRRMNEVKAREVQDTVEDLMYMCVLEKFVALSVSMLPRMDGVVDVQGTNLMALTEGIHSKEALEMVKDHLMSMMGPTANAYSNQAVKMSKLQMTQVYAASIMFGYFLRRVDSRFQLEKVTGTLDDSVPADEASVEVDSDTIARLERLFNAADVELSSSDSADEDIGANPDIPTPKPQGLARKASLKSYVASFDSETMLETARMLSIEAAALVERQTTALFGDVKELQVQMSEAIGDDATSMEDLMKRIQEAVQSEKVATLTMNVGTQKRAVLEAVAFGTFLRDVETHVEAEYALLTAAPPLSGPGLIGE